MTQITLPHRWKPRAYQQPLWNALEAGATRVAAVWHRRAGKDAVGLNWCATQAFQHPGLYWHVLPTYKQGRKIVWEGKTRDGRDFLSAFPKELVTRVRDDEMTLWLEGGSMFQVVGGEDVDRLVGANPRGVVMSEYSLHNPGVWDYLRPILAENGGWAIFLYTPRGRNHGYQLYTQALENQIEKGGVWWAQVLTVDDTNAIPTTAIEDDRRSGMPEELIQQEYYCSFNASLVGAYWGEQMNHVDREKRITVVPYCAEYPVLTGWDLGIGDSTVIWFAQQVGLEVRVIDHYESSGKGIEHYINLLREKPYSYGDHLVPHDAAARNLGSGKTIVEVARSMGIQLRVVPRLGLEDGIQAVRTLIPRCVFDATKCERGIEALRSYRKEYDTERQTYRDRPRHDWSSHHADAFRTLAVGMRPAIQKRESRDLAPQLAMA